MRDGLVFDVVVVLVVVGDVLEKRVVGNVVVVLLVGLQVEVRKGLLRLAVVVVVGAVVLGLQVVVMVVELMVLLLQVVQVVVVLMVLRRELVLVLGPRVKLYRRLFALLAAAGLCLDLLNEAALHHTQERGGFVRLWGAASFTLVTMGSARNYHVVDREVSVGAKARGSFGTTQRELTEGCTVAIGIWWTVSFSLCGGVV